MTPASMVKVPADPSPATNVRSSDTSPLLVNFNSKYLNLLKSGGSKHYKEILKDFDLDPSKKDFWQMGMKIIKNFIDELEDLS